MKSPFRTIIRLFFLFVVLVLLAIGGVLAVFTSWRSDKLAVLDGGSEMALTSAGSVEYVATGDGPPVLVFHSAPGGYDQALVLGAGLKAAGFQIIAPSRPGYLRTPLATGILPEEQADAMAALLDTLGLANVAVLGVSAGGPAALQFAVRYSNRVSALILVSAVSGPKHFDVKAGKDLLGQRVNARLTGDIGSWIVVELAEYDPRSLLDTTLSMTSTAPPEQQASLVGSVLSDADQVQWFNGLVGTVAPMSPRETGLRNDMVQFRKIPEVRFENILAPTLIIHGTADSDVPFADAEAMAKRMPGATFLPLEGIGHIVELGPQANEVRTKMAEFLNQNAKVPQQP